MEDEDGTKQLTHSVRYLSDTAFWAVSAWDYGLQRRISAESWNCVWTEQLTDAVSFEEWLKNVQRNEKKETAENGRPPSYEFMAIRKSDRRIVGMINVRYDLTEEMYRYLGHIGYCVRKSERQKGYAAEMLRLALKEAKKIGMDRVLLTVDSDKTASIATMKKNGALL